MKCNIRVFFESLSRILKVPLKSDKNSRYFTWRPLYIYDSISVLIIMRSVSDKRCKRKNTSSPITFSPKIVPLLIYCGKTWWSQMGNKWQYNTAHAHYLLDTWGYRDTLKICNIYCFSTATVVTIIHLSVTLYVNCLSYIPRTTPTACVGTWTHIGPL